MLFGGVKGVLGESADWVCDCRILDVVSDAASLKKLPVKDFTDLFVKA